MIVDGKISLVGQYCIENSLPYREYSTPGNYIFHRNEMADNSTFIKYGRGYAFLACVNDVCIFGDGFFLTTDGHTFVHGLNHRNYHLDIDDYVVSSSGNSIKLDIPEISTELLGSAILIWGNRNFGHWMFEHLPRIVIAAREAQLRDMAYIITDDMPDRYIDFIVAAGIPREQLVKLTPGKSTFVQELWVHSVPNYRGHYNDKLPYIWTDGMHYLRSKILNDDAYNTFPKLENRKRLYISRRSAEWRKPDNDELVHECLESFGVEEVDMNGMSYEDQIDNIKNAELIVIAAGASSIVTMYAPKGCVVIELIPDTVEGTFGTMVWAHMLGQYYQRIAGTAIEKTVDSNYIIDIDQLKKCMILGERYLRPKLDFFQEMSSVINA